MQRKIYTDFQGAVAEGGWWWWWLQLFVRVEFCVRLGGVGSVRWLWPALSAAGLGRGFWQVAALRKDLPPLLVLNPYFLVSEAGVTTSLRRASNIAWSVRWAPRSEWGFEGERARTEQPP